MRNSWRMFLVSVMVVAVSFYPAAAWHPCGGCGSYEPVYYGPVYDHGCCGEAVVIDDCYLRGEPCGCDGVVVDGAPSEPMHEPTPMPPAQRPPTPTLPPQQPETVERPAEVAPAPVQPMPPAEEPDDLFNGTEEAAPPATEQPEPPAEEPEDIFGQPAETPPPADTTPAEEPAEEPLDLFGEPAETEPEMPADTEEAPAEEAPAEEPPAEEPATEEEDDIFGASRGVLREAGGLASDQMRVWIDNTGSYSTQGRLISLLDSHVQLLKDNGRTATVPLSRLSRSDLEFVHRQASAQQAQAYQTVHSQFAMPELAN